MSHLKPNLSHENGNWSVAIHEDHAPVAEGLTRQESWRLFNQIIDRYHLSKDIGGNPFVLVYVDDALAETHHFTTVSRALTWIEQDFSTELAAEGDQDLADMAVDEADEEPPAPHSPIDSLTYLARGVNGLIDLAVDDIHGVYADTITDTEDLPEHLSDAVSALETAARIIQHEATLHGAYRRRSYDNGVPTSGVRKQPQREPQDDGTDRLVFTDVHYDLYPDGVAFHPISRDYKETA